MNHFLLMFAYQIYFLIAFFLFIIKRQYLFITSNCVNLLQSVCLNLHSFFYKTPRILPYLHSVQKIDLK